MGTMQDAMNAHLEELQAATMGSVKQVMNGEVADAVINQSVSFAPASVEVDEDALADIISARLARREQFVATRNARDMGLRQRRDRLEKNEMNMRDLYREKPEIERLLQEEIRKLAEAKRNSLIHDIPVLQTGVQELTEDLVNVATAITVLETRYPELKAKLEEEQKVIAAHRRFLERFSKEVVGETVRYIGNGTPTPRAADIKAADHFLEKSIKDASELLLIVSVTKVEEALFVAHDGSRWNPQHPELAEGIEVCSELALYEQAIKAADQERLRVWAERDREAGLLLAPQTTATQKKDPRNRHSIVNMVRCGDGYCFVPIMSKKSADLLTYSNVFAEMRVEYGDNKEGNKKHMLRVTAVTAPQFVEDVFFPEAAAGKCVTPTFYFDDLHEISTWRRINAMIRESLTNAVRWAESKEREIAVMEELGDISRLKNLKTLVQLADGVAGIAVIRIPKSKYGNTEVGFQIVSDGMIVRPGSVATDRSKKLSVYEAILDGKPVTEFFARAKDGSFVNEQLQDFAVRNESFELNWLVPIAVAEYTAEQVSNVNIVALVMPTNGDGGGKNGKYVLRTSVKEKHGEVEVYREVGYVVAREDEKIIFVEGLTPYSVTRFRKQGFALNTPYMLGDLRGFILYLLQRVYCKALDVHYDELPEFLKRRPG